MTHIIVSRSHPVQYYSMRFLMLLLAIAMLWGAYEFGYQQSEEDVIEAKGGRSSLIVQQKVLKKKNSDLSKELLHLERKYLLEQESSQIIKAGMIADQKKIAELEKELEFFKAIVSPAKDKKSIYLQSMEIAPLPAHDKQTAQYRYKFILAQKIKQKTYTKGSVTIFIKGKKDNKTVKLSMFSLKDSSSDKKSKDKTFTYSFKYFQEFSGIINLPEGMVPESVDIIMDSKKKKSIVELTDLAWSENGGIKYVGQ